MYIMMKWYTVTGATGGQKMSERVHCLALPGCTKGGLTQ